MTKHAPTPGPRIHHNTANALLRALKGVKSHNEALKPQFKLSESLMRQVDAAIALAEGGQ